jgi:hypothetical protein
MFTPAMLTLGTNQLRALTRGAPSALTIIKNLAMLNIIIEKILKEIRNIVDGQRNNLVNCLIGYLNATHDFVSRCDTLT